MKRLVTCFFLVILCSASISIADQNKQVMVESRIAIFNPDSLEASLTVTPVDLKGQTLSPSVHSIPTGRSIILDGEDLGLQPGFSGSLTLESDRPIVGMEYSRYSYPQLSGETNRGLTATALQPLSGLDQKAYLPLVQNSNGARSYIAIQNAGVVNTDLLIDCFSEASNAQIIAQAVLPGATRLVRPPNDFEGTAVVTSSDTDISVQLERTYSNNWMGSSYNGIPDADSVAQSAKSFIWNEDIDALLTKIAIMNAGETTADGIVQFKGDSDTEWEQVDYPNILSYHGATIAPPSGETWELGQSIITLFLKQASIAHTTNDDLSISYSTIATPYPAPLLSEWYIPYVTNKTEIDLFHDDAISTDFKITYKYGTTEQTSNFTLGAYVHQIISPPLPDDTEGFAIIENLTAFPTGLAIEVRDKQNAGDYSAYVPAYISSMTLFAPWFSYKYQLMTSLIYSIIPLLLLNN